MVKCKMDTNPTLGGSATKQERVGPGQRPELRVLPQRRSAHGLHHPWRALYDSRVRHPLTLISVLASLLYFVSEPWHPFSGSIVLKGLSVGPLAVLAWRSSLPGRDGLLLGCALAFGSLGDVLLDWNASLFPAGLGAFLIGHFFYIGLFWKNRPRPTRLAMWEIALLAGLALFASAMSLYLLPATGELAPAVVMYMGALMGMVASTVALQLPARWVVVGALLFLFSDTVLAVSKFKSTVPGRELLVWPTYYVGQLLIAVGYLRAKTAGGLLTPHQRGIECDSTDT